MNKKDLTPVKKRITKIIRKGIPETGFVRLPQILQVIPVGESTFWRWVKSGKAPKGIKISTNTTAWKAEDIHALITSLGQECQKETS